MAVAGVDRRFDWVAVAVIVGPIAWIGLVPKSWSKEDIWDRLKQVAYGCAFVLALIGGAVYLYACYTEPQKFNKYPQSSYWLFLLGGVVPAYLSCLHAAATWVKDSRECGAFDFDSTFAVLVVCPIFPLVGVSALALGHTPGSVWILSSQSATTALCLFWGILVAFKLAEWALNRLQWRD